VVVRTAVVGEYEMPLEPLDATDTAVGKAVGEEGGQDLDVDGQEYKCYGREGEEFGKGKAGADADDGFDDGEDEEDEEDDGEDEEDEEGEEGEDVVHLYDCSYDVMVCLMEYLYTDQIEILSANTPLDLDFSLDLLGLADTYEVKPLSRMCERWIKRSISTKNVAAMLKTADERNVPALRKKCFDFVLLHFGEVIGSEAFTQLPQQILSEVLTAASQRGVTIGNTGGAAGAAAEPAAASAMEPGERMHQ
jgi:hypothetical protein